MTAEFVYLSGKTEIKTVPVPLSPVFSIIKQRRVSAVEDIQDPKKMVPVIQRFELQRDDPPMYKQVPIDPHFHKYFRILPEGSGE